MSVAVDPNILKLIEVPVTISGEANGTVTLVKDGEARGLGRIIVGFFTSNNKPVGKTLTEPDGFFSYFGLSSGSYLVRIDTAQLLKLGMTSEPESLAFKIAAGIDGDIVDGLDFTLKMKAGDTTAAQLVVPEKPVVRKDTSYMIIHEVTQELITIAEDSWAIQLGAFKRKEYAEAYRRKLEKLLGKDIEIVIEGDFYKLRIIDLKPRQEVDDNISILRKNGVNELWVLRLKAKQQQLLLTEKTDTVTKITETVAEGKIPVISFEMKIQVGAFHDESNALGLKDKLSSLLDKPVVIINEDGYHKVQITGFENLEEIEKFLPKLGFLGQKDIWVPPVKKQAEVIPPVKVQPDTAKKVVEEKVEIPVVEEKPAIPEPTIALQVGVFHSKTRALRAQRRIISKLNLPVEIIQQWDYYHVIVTGFFTKEETYKYYPELTGLGYPGISLIENYKQQK